MNSGYSSGWCAESFGIPLTTVEICCEAQGAEHVALLLWPHPIKFMSIWRKLILKKNPTNHEVPVFFQRKYNEDKLRQSLLQKETLAERSTSSGKK
jgi:hypothetical protein